MEGRKYGLNREWCRAEPILFELRYSNVYLEMKVDIQLNPRVIRLVRQKCESVILAGSAGCFNTH